MNLAKSSLKIFGARLGGSTLGFLGTVYFARELGASQFGVFVLFQAVSQMLAVPADFGVQGAVIKRMSERENSSEVFATAIVMLSASLVVVCSAVFLLRGFINSYLGAQLAIYLVVVIVLNQLSKLVENVLKGELRVGETASLHFLRQLVFNGLGAILLFSGAEVVGLVAAFIAGLAVVIIAGVFKVQTPVGQPSIETARSLFDFAKFSVVSYVDSYLYNWLDVAVLGVFVTQSAVGAYEVAWRISMIVVLFTGAIETAILPQISSWDAEDAQTRIEAVLPDAITGGLVLVIPAFFGVSVLAREILAFVFAPEYTTAWLVLIILVGGKLFEGVDRIFKNLLSGMDRPDLRAIAVVVSICLNVCLNVTLVWAIGMLGAAIATVVSFAVSTAIIGYYLSTLITIRLPTNELLACVVSATCMAVVLLATKQYIQIQSLLAVGSAVAVGGGVYGTVLCSFASMRGKAQTAVRAVIR